VSRVALALVTSIVAAGGGGAACGGGGRESVAPRAATSPGPVLHPEADPDRPDPPVGTLVRDDATPPRAVMVSSRVPLSAPSDGDDMIHAPRRPSMFDEPMPALTGRPPPKGCDPAPETAKGQDAMAVGNDAMALAAFERALVCVDDPKLERFATLAACRAKNFARARYHFVRLPEAMKNQLVQICRPSSFVDL